MIKTLSNLLKQDKEKYKVPRKVQDVIPIRRMWSDGIFQVGSKFSKSYQFSDINYQVASLEDKKVMFLDYSELLNALDSGASAKVTINNRRLNKAEFEAALLLMYIIARPGISETLLIALFTLLYPPLVRYINLSMMEMPCYACVIVYMALLLRYEKEQSGALPRSFWTLPLLFVCGLYCTLLRMSNVVLFFPAILIFCHNRLSLKLLLCLVLYALGTLAFNYCFSLFVAPYPDALYTLMQSDSLAELLRGLWLNTRTNIINYLDPFSDNSLPQAMARYFYLLVLLALLGKTLLKREGGRMRLTWRWAYFGVFAAGAAGLLIVLTIYYVFDWRDYRTLAPLAYCMVLWLLLRWSGEGRGFRLGLAALMLFGLLMAPESYGHVAQDPRFYPDESTGLDYSELFGDEACTLGLYGTAYDLALMKDVPANVGICGGIYEENTHGYGMDYILSLPGDPAPSPEYYEYYAPMEGYGDLYRRLTD